MKGWELMLNKETLTVNDLLSANKSELKELFTKCEPFKLEELNGHVNGTVINGNGIWGNKLGLFLTNLFWKGKAFAPDEKIGRNILSLGFFDFTFFKFKTNIEQSKDYNGNVFTLRYKYKFSLNPFPIRIIVDEMRKINDGLFLGTGNFNILGKLINIKK